MVVYASVVGLHGACGNHFVSISLAMEAAASPEFMNITPLIIFTRNTPVYIR